MKHFALNSGVIYALSVYPLCQRSLVVAWESVYRCIFQVVSMALVYVSIYLYKLLLKNLFDLKNPEQDIKSPC